MVADIPFHVLALLAITCYLLPYAIEAKTGKTYPGKLYNNFKGTLAPWKSFFLLRYIAIQTLNSTIMFVGLITFIFGWKSGIGEFYIISVPLVLISFLLGVVMISWAGWISKGS